MSLCDSVVYGVLEQLRKELEELHADIDICKASAVDLRHLSGQCERLDQQLQQHDTMLLQLRNDVSACQGGKTDPGPQCEERVRLDQQLAGNLEELCRLRMQVVASEETNASQHRHFEGVLQSEAARHEKHYVQLVAAVEREELLRSEAIAKLEQRSQEQERRQEAAQMVLSAEVCAQQDSHALVMQEQCEELRKLQETLDDEGRARKELQANVTWWFGNDDIWLQKAPDDNKGFLPKEGRLCLQLQEMCANEWTMHRQAHGAELASEAAAHLMQQVQALVACRLDEERRMHAEALERETEARCAELQQVTNSVREVTTLAVQGNHMAASLHFHMQQILQVGRHLHTNSFARESRAQTSAATLKNGLEVSRIRDELNRAASVAIPDDDNDDL